MKNAKTINDFAEIEDKNDEEQKTPMPAKFIDDEPAFSHCSFYYLSSLYQQNSDV